MRIARFFLKNKIFYGFVLNDVVINFNNIGKILNIRIPKDDLNFIFNEKIIRRIKEEIEKEKLKEKIIKKGYLIKEVKLLAPIPNPPKIICLGLNYIDHAEEQNVSVPKEPIIFFKPRTSITGPYDDIICPSFVKQLDYEGELAVIIGKKGKNIPIEKAMDYVFGYMIMNDVSARDIQFSDKQWTRGKSFDTFAPCGPWIVTKDEIIDPHSLKILTYVNNEIRQNSSTNKMFLKIPEIISSLSKVMTLEPGDIISTGTPAGVGIFMKPEPKLLKNGDIVRIEIEKIGAIENKVVIVD
jgi:2-keto-4-pentenoate hydratase/2-oxohepta-3-ene-1,7-dioic acid hydratase in catechol pathway